jgi:hypothetical protein
MEESMEMMPPRWLATVVRLLVPPICREHVLGDLQERLQAARPSHAALLYLRDSLQTIPFVIWSQIRRGIDPALLSAQTLVIYGAFVSGAFYVSGGGLTFLSAHHGLWLVAVPTLVSLTVLTVADAYTAHCEASPPLQAGLVALALGIAWLVNRITRYMAPHWAVPTAVLTWGLMLSWGCTPALRYMWATRHAQAALAMGSRSNPDLHVRARRLARDMGRRTRTGYVLTLGLVAGFGWFAFIAVNRVQRIGASLIVAACLYLTYQLRQARPSPLPADPNDSAWPLVYRAELVRQRDFHGGPLFWWRLVALVPGCLLFLAGAAVARPAIIRPVGMASAAFLLFGGLAIPLNLRLARRHQQQLDALNEEHLS